MLNVNIVIYLLSRLYETCIFSILNFQNKFGLPGDGPAQFMLPHDIVTTQEGHLLVADRENGRVQELTTTGEFVREWSSR